MDQVWQKRGIGGASINREAEQGVHQVRVDGNSDLGGIGKTGFLEGKIGNGLL